MKNLAKNVLAYLDGCEYSEFDKNDIVSGILVGMKFEIKYLIRWDCVVARPSDWEVQIVEYKELIKFVEANEANVNKLGKRWWNKMEKEYKAYCAADRFNNDGESRVFGYAAYCDMSS